MITVSIGNVTADNYVVETAPDTFSKGGSDGESR